MHDKQPCITALCLRILQAVHMAHCSVAHALSANMGPTAVRVLLATAAHLCHRHTFTAHPQLHSPIQGCTSAFAALTPGLGPVDGTLGSCAGIDPCSSSYDDRPPHFVAPWQFDGTQAVAVRDLVDTLEVGATATQCVFKSGDGICVTVLCHALSARLGWA
jgi:hypothetical protein